MILLVGRLPGRNSACGEPPWLYMHNSGCGEALGLKWISVWNPTYTVVIRGAIKKSVGSPPGRKSVCGEPPAKRITGLFYPRSAYMGLSGPLWASLGLSGLLSLSGPKSRPSYSEI